MIETKEIISQSVKNIIDSLLKDKKFDFGLIEKVNTEILNKNNGLITDKTEIKISIIRSYYNE